MEDIIDEIPVIAAGIINCKKPPFWIKTFFFCFKDDFETIFLSVLRYLYSLFLSSSLFSILPCNKL